MSTLLLTIQIVCYGVGIVSAALNIASILRHWRVIDPALQGDEAGDWR